MNEVSKKNSRYYFPKMTKLYCRKWPLLLCLFFIQFFSLCAFAQKTITGIVKDETGTALAGVTVSVKNQSIATTTDVEGNYSIKVPDLKSVLVFTSIGFKNKEVIVNDWNPIQVILEGKVSTLNDAVVIGYGKQSRQLITTSISKLDNKVLENIPYQNVATAMQGTIAGVRVQTTTGQPGAAPRVIIRGGTSINNPNGASPLYIVDGVIRSLDDISPDDIESLQVLKDAAATSIYGARGSNGVVLVKTKSGKAGSIKVNYNYDFTNSNTLNAYKFVGAREYITALRLGFENTGRTPAQVTAALNEARSYGVGNDLTQNTQWTNQYLSPANEHKLKEGWESMPDPVDPTKTIIFKETDFYSKVFQTGRSHNHYVSVSGGSERSSFNAAVGYMSAQGTVRTTDYDRLTLNLNGDIKVRDNLTFTGRVNYSGAGDNHSQLISDYSIMKYASLPGNMKYTYEDGTLAHGRNETLGNPDYYFPLFDNKGDELTKQKLSLSLSSHWKILPGLSFDPQISLFNDQYRTNSFRPQFYNGVTTRTLNTSRDASSSYGLTKQQQADALFNYTKQFGKKHNLSAVAGFTYLGTDVETLSAAGRGAATDNIITLNASSIPVSVSSGISQRRLLSYLYGINYDYKQKYLLTLNGRYDGASNLGETHKWGFFPGVALGWNVHKETFWKALPEGLNLKLRASYGVNGNLGPLGDYQAQGTYSTGAIYLGGSAIQNTVLPNPDLRWEESKTLDFGADVGLFNNRINILFDVYRRVTDNLLTNLSLPPSTGFGTILTNFGSLEGKGIEFELAAHVFPAASAFQWEISLNAAKVKNKILKLPASGVEKNRVGGIFIWDDKAGTYTWQGGLQEGDRIGDMFAYKQESIYATDAEAAAGPKDIIINSLPRIGGDVKFMDRDGNGIIDDRDRIYVGNPYPVWTGGFSNYFSYKNLSLAVRMDYATGHTINNAMAQQFNQNAIGDVNMLKEFYDKSWKKQGDITDVPRYTFVDARSNMGRGNSTYFVNADYLALREVTLSYILPVKLMQKMKMNSLKLNLTGNNLHYFTAKSRAGVIMNNLEDGGQDLGQYSLSRNFTFGASLTF